MRSEQERKAEWQRMSSNLTADITRLFFWTRDEAEEKAAELRRRYRKRRVEVSALGEGHDVSVYKK